MVSGQCSRKDGHHSQSLTERCRLALLMLPGLSLELRIAVLGLEWALMIDGADVQWANEDTAGLAFVRTREAERQRLSDVMTTWLARKSEGGGEKQLS